ncbi:hypothetical protein IW140_002957 [Coemansia sp. RSA 1813]|nr:hypothetical protein EV178_003838 [Coemansia sp. RSA 1646]KAJ1770615.1 hypothetical protein LPJ74_003064 [Coemansia sp. RSA 1843]KAJ2091387.1 hypothetical protein IW138_001846 [Coemansia sp. RSA 986]KAJ2212856.1 hypothetical protein EV179_004343 [Coemansia sp. RSA 487]KAJ2569549.1 hypothetical protein IW140_002957 [Coemansia sp. RSA 1813]
MSQEEPTLTLDQVTVQELALIQQMRVLEIRREQHVPKPGGQPPLSLIKYDNRRYLEVRQGFQPILVPEHMVTIVRTFLAENLPQHIRSLRGEAQSPPDTPRSLSSLASSTSTIVHDVRLPPAFGSLGSSLLGSRYQPMEPASPPYTSNPTSPPMAPLGPSPFDQFSTTSEPLSPGPDESFSSSQVAPNMSYYESSLFTTVPSQGLYDQSNAAASFMASLPGFPLPSTTASMPSAIPSTPAAISGNLGLMSSPSQSLSSSYTNSHDFGSSLLPPSTTQEEAVPSPQLSLAGSASSKHTRKVSTSAQRKVSRSMARKQNSMPYPDTGSITRQDTSNSRIQALRSDDGDSTMDVDDGYDGDGNNDDNMSTASSSNNGKSISAATSAASADKETGTKMKLLPEDEDGDDDQPLRKPPNAFILYRRMKNEKLRAERPGISVETASGVIGKFWREEPEEVKREFHELANKAREVYFAKKKRLLARQKQRRLEREEQLLQQQEQKNPGSTSLQELSRATGSKAKPKRKTSKSLSSPPPSLVVSCSRDLSSFSPESLAKKKPASAGCHDAAVNATIKAAPPVRMTRSLSDTYNSSSSKQSLRESLTMPAMATSQQKAAGSLSTLLEHNVELGASNDQSDRSLGEAHTSPDMERHVSATVATLKQVFDEVRRSQPTSPVATPSELDVSGPQWSPDSQAMEQNVWNDMFNKLFPNSN